MEKLKENIDYSNEDEIESKTKKAMEVISQCLNEPFIRYTSLDYIAYGDLVEGCDYRDLVKLIVPYIIFNNTEYNVYFTDLLGYSGSNDYIITKKRTSLIYLYSLFKRNWEEQQLETLSKEEFEDHMFTIDKNANYIKVKI